jgi:phosphotransferase system HPr (HPr) family protein
MQEFEYTIKDPNGIHARPAGFFVQELQKYASSVSIAKDGASCDGKKLFALMKLRVKANETITIQVEGNDEEIAAVAAKAFLESNM